MPVAALGVHVIFSYCLYSLAPQAAVGEEGALPMSADPDPIKILTTEAEVAGWNSEGLPNDQVLSRKLCDLPETTVASSNSCPEHRLIFERTLHYQVSTENGAIVCNSARWPLIIDPQLQVSSTQVLLRFCPLPSRAGGHSVGAVCRLGDRTSQ